MLNAAKQTGLVLVLIAMLLIAATTLAALTLFLAGTLGAPASLTSGEYAGELYARLFLAILLAMIYAPFLLLPPGRALLRLQRSALVIAILFAGGALFALGDPFSAVSAEGNFIRYWTSGVLSLAGGLALFGAVRPGETWIDRLGGLGAGLVFLAAAADEIFQLHERIGAGEAEEVASATALQAQDLVTLGIAGVGVLAVVGLVLAPRLLPQAREMAADPRYRTAFGFFALAAASFLLAMLLDTFDTVLADLAVAVHGIPDPVTGPDFALWIGAAHVIQAANGLEELLEYLAAIAFLMVIGAVFEIRRLGFPLDHGD